MTRKARFGVFFFGPMLFLSVVAGWLVWSSAQSDPTIKCFPASSMGGCDLTVIQIERR